jgi:hypothetical protein
MVLMRRPSIKPNPLLIIGVVSMVVVVCLIVYLGISIMEKAQQAGENEEMLSTAEMENLAKQKVREYWENLGQSVEYWENLGYPIQLFELNEPLAGELVVKHKIYTSLIPWDYGHFCIVAVGRYDGRTFALPDEFNGMIPREINVVDENKALNLSKLYVLLWAQYPQNSGLVFVENTTSIPSSGGYAAGENPDKYENIVEPPQVSLNGENYRTSFYTWSEDTGLLCKWQFEVGNDGRVSNQIEQIATVGSYGSPPQIICD